MDKNLIEKKTKQFIERFRDSYAEYSERYNYDPELKEMSDDDIKGIVEEYFSFDKLTEANKYFYRAFDKFVPDTWDQIDHALEREAMEQTPEFKQWYHHSHVSSAWYSAFQDTQLENAFCDLHGKVRADEEAATLAADKWCELLFNWHLQDNGALNEDHPGGFTACALGTILADKSRERITEEMKKKAHELFYQYYLGSIRVQNSRDYSAVKWAQENLKDPDTEKPYEWGVHSFLSNLMYCDYSPYMPLYLVLVNAGIPEHDATSICPWKTGISIRALDNTVEYRTYQKCEEL